MPMPFTYIMICFLKRSNMVNILQVVILSVCISVPVLVAVAWIVMGKSMDGK